MQKIIEKLKNTPGGVQLLQAPCFVSSGLNREETLSVQNKVLSIINSDGVYNFGGLTWRMAIDSCPGERGLLAAGG